MPKLPASTAPLSPQRAFVIQLAEPTDDPPDRFSGRVEHVVSGQAIWFVSLAELAAFMQRVLASQNQQK